MSTWQDLASERQAGEDSLIERFRATLFDRDESDTSDDPDRTVATPWGAVGHRFHRGLYITDFRRRSAWPETQLVLDVFWEAHPERRFIVMKGIWPPERIQEPEPPENELFDLNLWESIVTRARRWLRVQPGPVVYFIWSSPVDLEDPPASGNPPQELLAARAETANIKSHWLGS